MLWAIFGALLMGCSDEEIANVETSSRNAIGFNVLSNAAETRATPTTPSNLLLLGAETVQAVSSCGIFSIGVLVEISVAVVLPSTVMDLSFTTVNACGNVKSGELQLPVPSAAAGNVKTPENLIL